MGFTKSVRFLIVPQQDDRSLDQYLVFRDAVFVIVESEKFLNDLQQGWAPFTDNPLNEIGNATLMELKAFTLAIEVAQTTEKDRGSSKGWLSRMLGRGSTTLGSVKDLFENLPPYAKAAITLFKELIELFKNKE